MSTPTAGAECPPELLSGVVDLVRDDDERGLARLDELLGEFGGDAKLHFLKGSVLAGLKRYPEARESMRRAVDIAPLFAVARFQLGLLELSSGEGEAADETLQPLEQLGAENPYALFARGLRLLMRDEFEGALAALREGIVRNTENPPINRDMQLIIAEIQQKLGAAPVSDEPATATQMLLKQFAAKGPKH